MPEHAHRQHFRPVGDACPANAVVGGFGNRAGHVRAVPAAVAGHREQPAVAVFGNPIAEVQCAGHTLGRGATREERIGDEVVAGEQIAGQIRVIGQDAGIQYRHYDAFALRCFPGLRDVDATHRVDEMPLIGLQQRIVRQCAAGLQRIHAQIHLRRFDVRVCAQFLHKTVGIGATELGRQFDQFAARGKRAQIGWRCGGTGACGRRKTDGCARSGRTDCRRGSAADIARGADLPAAVADDDSVDRRIGHGLLALGTGRCRIGVGGQRCTARRSQDTAGKHKDLRRRALDHDGIPSR